MADTTAPKCGGRGRLATNYSLGWYKCTTRKERYEVHHTECSVSGCASSVDDEESGLCWYHAAQAGIHLDGGPFQPDHSREPE